MSIPTRPRIRKHGTVKLHTVETTPIVFGDRLYRFEYVRPADLNPANRERRSHFHFVDLRTGQATPPFAYDHHMGSAYTDGGVMYAVGAAGCCGSDTLHIFRSGDLREWELWGELSLPGHEIYNTGICKRDGAYTLLYEIAAEERIASGVAMRGLSAADTGVSTSMCTRYIP